MRVTRSKAKKLKVHQIKQQDEVVEVDELRMSGGGGFDGGDGLVPGRQAEEEPELVPAGSSGSVSAPPESQSEAEPSAPPPPPFNPARYGLEESFRLTKFTDLQGYGCNVPRRETFGKFLEGLKDSPTSGSVALTSRDKGGVKMGIRMDMDNGSVTPTRIQGTCLAQTTNFLYPLVDDPYIQGKIACANVLSDLYAKGVTDCDNMLMLLGVSNKLSKKERDVVVPLMMQGFKDTAARVGTSVTGGQTLVNPWIIIGGVATSVCSSQEIISSSRASPGDVLVLTKPLGTQVALNAHQWLETMPEHYERIKKAVSPADIAKGYVRALNSMTRLNLTAARLMHKYNAHCATSVAGRGVLGHAENLVKKQNYPVNFVIHNLPVIKDMAKIARAAGDKFRFLKGYSAETSGGLLISFEREDGEKFCREILEQEGYPAWVVGIVEHGYYEARIVEVPFVTDVPLYDKSDRLW